MAYKLPNPERERTERNRELKRLRSPDEEDRVQRAAALMLVFHEERDINHVMELAQIVMDAADDGVDVLVTTYLEDVADAEDRMERLAMLANVGRWIESAALEDVARDRGVAVAADWCGQVNDEIDRAERFSVVERRFDADVRKAVQARFP
ncbi:hypothetical protein [Euzebya rosea]|uniref:hypothetical protein n=1 Tax=Euzebya rosea TaxID=2052804 RepID=UPI000D3EA67F|nr:hypothetical protein [Euzebya rosea]